MLSSQYKSLLAYVCVWLNMTRQPESRTLHCPCHLVENFLLASYEFESQHLEGARLPPGHWHTSTVCSTCAVLCHDVREVPNLLLALWNVPLNRLRHLLVLDILLDGCRKRKNNWVWINLLRKCLTILLILSIYQKLVQKLDDGWPESVEEQGLLLLVWRHHITKQYVKDVLYAIEKRSIKTIQRKYKTVVCIVSFV